jgi:two-component system NarL family response regulator
VIRLLLADDHYVVLMGLAALLRQESDLEVVATAETGAEALDLYRQHKPDVALLDLRMPGLDGAEVTHALRAEFPHARVLLLTSFDTEEDVHRALQAGASGYLLKTARRPELVAAIRAAHAGGQWIPREVAARAAERAAQPALSPRQREVLDLVAKGLSNKEIASVLGFTEDGTKQHLRQIYARLGVTDRAEATAEAIRRGIIRRD